MWTSGMLKENAKASLKRFYWMALLVTFVTTWITGRSFGSGSGFKSVKNFKYDNSSVDATIESFKTQLSGMLGIFGTILIVSLIVGLAIGFAYAAFVAGPIRTGQARYFMLSRGFEKVSFSKLFYCFQSGKYMNVVKTSFMKELYIFLWSLLFWIPGIIKSYQYAMVEYIMCENPNMDYQRALELSRAMTDGEKWHVFVTQLSFIGWYLLGVIACCIGTYFVNPYYEATMAELYTVLRTKAFNQGLTNENELPGFELAD